MPSDQLNRREFITLLGGAAATWPLAARAQQPAMPVIGYLSMRSAKSDLPMLAAFRQGLNETGFVEGKNVTIEYRWGDGQYDRLPAFAANLVRQRVAVIVTSGGGPAALAAKMATTEIPVVFNMGEDAVRAGLIASINRPGGNLTGVMSLLDILGAKQLGLLRELVPRASTIAMLVNPNDTWAEVSLIADALVARDIRFVFVTGYGDHGLPAYRDRPTLRKPFQIDALKCALQERLGTG